MAISVETKYNKLEQEEQLMDFQYTIFRPGGNDTALVLGIPRDPAVRKKINDEIMARHSNVEQVGFISRAEEKPELMMAGGEFCGNATRSTAYFLLGGKTGELSMTVSGVDVKLKAGVSESGEAWAQMPIYVDPKKVSSLSDGAMMVEMKGITHVVKDNPFQNRKDPEFLKQYALDSLEKLGLTENYPACGLMLLTRSGGVIQMEPIVWVKSIQTLFYETACGSGTTAVGLVEALKNGQSVNIPIIQPSGIPISISVSFDGQQFIGARISGPIQQLTPLAQNK